MLRNEALCSQRYYELMKTCVNFGCKVNNEHLQAVELTTSKADGLKRCGDFLRSRTLQNIILVFKCLVIKCLLSLTNAVVQ